MVSFRYTLIVLALLNFGCATMKNSAELEDLDGGQANIIEQTSEEPPSAAPERRSKKSWKESYIGSKGYITRPPLFETQGDREKFQRCLPFTIKNFESRSGKVVMTIEQGGNQINLTGANRQYFKLSSKLRLRELDSYFVKKLDRGIASVDKACSGQIAQSMTEKEFLFVVGTPEKVNIYTKNNQKVQEWVYVSKDGNAPPMAYYFSRGRFYAWKRP